MFWGITNLILAIMESIVMWGCTLYFMSVNSRTIYRKKIWYLFAGTASAAIVFACSVIFPDTYVGMAAQLIMTFAIGILLFHKAVMPVILDLLLAVELFLGMECGIFIFNTMVPVMTQDNILMFANLGMIAKIVFMILMTWMMVKWRKGKDGIRLSAKQTLSVLVLPVFSVFFLFSIIEMHVVFVQLKGFWLVLANCFALLLLNLYFLYLFQYLFRTNKLEQEMKVFQIQNEVQFHYYEELEQKYRESRKIFHDMKNHLQSVEQLYEEKNKKAGDDYVKDLLHMINVLGEKFYSSNHMLNIILNEKLSQARRAGIKVTAEVGDVEFSDLKDIDITTIFANLLDNAVEASGEAGEGAFLNLKIDMVQEFRVVQICNSRAMDTGKQEARKQSHMGLGLVNVKYTLEKYHGSLQQIVTDKEYRVSVMIPGKE
ncbi:MAG: GHKL domain-containing protein [Eubacteriales bacterium]|nr:GHKL domain-containing protein [Eubacteriales bacterium]